LRPADGWFVQLLAYLAAPFREYIPAIVSLRAAIQDAAAPGRIDLQILGVLRLGRRSCAHQEDRIH
jgi:hypothetical protein